jgi:hypothetical protein
MLLSEISKETSNCIHKGTLLKLGTKDMGRTHMLKLITAGNSAQIPPNTSKIHILNFTAILTYTDIHINLIAQN